MPSLRGKVAQVIRLMDEIKFNRSIFQVVLVGLAVMIAASAGCDSAKAPTIATPTSTAVLESQDVQNLIAHAVEQAERLGVAANIAVTDREANVLGVFAMTGTAGSADNPIIGAIAKARTAAYLSSNQHGFSTLTACFITRNHFPPNIGNTAAGPLFGVPRSSIGGGDIQPNGDLSAGRPGLGQQGLTGVPGGVPIFRNGLLAGGLGVSTGPPAQPDLNNILCCCSGVVPDELIALGGVLGGYETPANLRGDGILLDGIRLLYANAPPPVSNFTLDFFALDSRGSVDPRFPLRATQQTKFPQTTAAELFREVDLGVIDGVNYNFTIRAGSLLASEDVRRIISQAAAQAAKTRAAIRRPPGVPAQVFISVVDVNGAVLGIGRTPDATLFSFDVSAQKARTALAFSDPNNSLGQMVRRELELVAYQGFAISSRGVGFLAQDFYPPGISREEQSLGGPIGPGPFFIMPPGDGQEFIFQSDLPDFGRDPFGNGITIFPGGIPLYKNGQLAGGIGISGDGVDQDDIICFAGSVGFEPPEAFRCDQFSYREAKLPYVKFPRQPELD